jgi:hypothetical protein
MKRKSTTDAHFTQKLFIDELCEKNRRTMIRRDLHKSMLTASKFIENNYKEIMQSEAVKQQSDSKGSQVDKNSKLLSPNVEEKITNEPPNVLIHMNLQDLVSHEMGILG